ncbi:MAG: 3-hydroxyisobutyrate dehydrogenase [Pseudomonadota bacterium]
MGEIAFIGLGNMGLPMARNLLSAGRSVSAFDVSEAARARATAEGMRAAASVAEAVSGADVVVTMLPNGAILSAVYAELSAAAEAGALKAGAVAIDSSTVDVESARGAHATATAAGLLSVDAPVSGGVGGAEAGTLTFMAGGSDEAFAAAKPELEVMGGRIVHCGGPGSGQAAKICNNMLLGISMLGACEAFALAEKLGLSGQAAFEVISTSSGSCWSVNTYCPAPGVGPESPADRDYAPGFAAALMLKDLMLSQQAARASGLTTPMGAYAAELYEKFVADGGGEKDFSGVMAALRGG